MKKIGIKAFSLLVGVCLAVLPLAGCSDITWSAKVGKSTLPAGVYLYYLYSARSAIESGTAGKSGSSSTDSSKYWTQKIDGQSAADWAKADATKQTRELAAAEALCKERNLTLTADEKKEVASSALSMRASYPVLVANHISAESLEHILSYSYYLKDRLFQSYYGAGGTEAVPDADLKDYYTKNFVQIKQIFFSLSDTTTGSALSSDDQTKKKDKANQILGQISADRSNFDTLMNANNEDTGMQQNPDGYIFGKSENFVKEFKNAAFSMNVGDVKLVTTSLGYHIMYKVKLDDSKFDDNKSSVLSEMKNDAFLKTLDDYKGVTVNQNVAGHYSAKSLRTESDADSEALAAASAAAASATSSAASSSASDASSSASSSASSAASSASSSSSSSSASSSSAASK